MGLKILLVSQYFPPEMGALAARSYEHGLRWVQMGHHVTVICGTPNYPDGKIYEGFRNRLFQRQKVNGIDVVRTWILPKPTRNTCERILNYTSFFITSILTSLRLGKPDIVIGSSPQLLNSLAGYIIARIMRTPFVFEVRDLWPESIVASGPTSNTLLIRALREIANFLYQRADKIVVVTQPFKEYLSRMCGIDEGKIAVIPNGIDLATFDSKGHRCGDIRRAYALEGKFVVSYIGNIGAAHGIGTVLEAAARLREEKDIVFLLVGAGAEREKLEKEMDDRELDNVIFVGRRLREDTPAFLETSDVSLVLLRKREVFKTVIPTKMLESMAMAKPIVLGVEGEAKRIIEEAGAGLPIVPESSAELVDAIRKLKGDPVLRASLGKKGREYIERLHDRDKHAIDYVSVLVEVTSSYHTRDA